LKGLVTSNQSGGSVFSFELPAYARFEGVELGRAKLGGLQSIGLIYSQEPVPEEDLALLSLTQDLWLRVDDCPPRLHDEKVSDAGHVRPMTFVTRLHSLFTTPSVGRFLFNPQNDTLAFYLDHYRNDIAFGDQGSCGQAQMGFQVVDRSFLGRGVGSASNVLIDQSQPPNGFRLTIADRGARLIPSDVAHYGPLVRQSKVGASDADKIAWGGTFALPHRLANVHANFVGYDITQLDPHNILKATGSNKKSLLIPLMTARTTKPPTTI